MTLYLKTISEKLSLNLPQIEALVNFTGSYIKKGKVGLNFSEIVLILFEAQSFILLKILEQKKKLYLLRKIDAKKRIRTDDPGLTRPRLYLLSYGGRCSSRSKCFI